MDELELDNYIIIGRTHRATKSNYGKKNQPQKIACKLPCYKDQDKVL